MPSSVIGRPISGSLTPASAVSTCSRVGSGELMPLMVRAGAARACRAAPARGVTAWSASWLLVQPGSWLLVAGVAAADDRTGRRVEDQRGEVRLAVEVEHAAMAVKRSGDRVVRARDALAVQP